MKVYSLLTCAPLVLGVVWSLETFGVEPYAMTDAERRLLPPYCRSGKSSAELNMPSHHHLCEGLKFILRANKPGISQNERQFNLGSAIGELDYVLGHHGNHSNRRYLGAVSYHSANTHYRLGDNQTAIEMYYKAIEYNPSLEAAYLKLAELFQDLGMGAEARAELERGLARLPQSAHLKRELDKLSQGSE